MAVDVALSLSSRNGSPLPQMDRDCVKEQGGHTNGWGWHEWAGGHTDGHKETGRGGGGSEQVE